MVTTLALEKLAVEFSQKHDEEEFKIYYKFHPSEFDGWESKYPLLKSSERINIIPDTMELYKVLAMAKYHVTVYSTVLYESLVYDVRRFVYDIGEVSEVMYPLIDAGGAETFHDLREFEDLLGKEPEYDRELSERVWTEHAAENGLAAFQKIIGE